MGCSPWGRKESDTTERLHFHFSLSCTGEGNGNPLQCSCLENARDGGAWWAAVYGVAQSRTRLKRLSSSSSRKDVKNIPPRERKPRFEVWFCPQKSSSNNVCRLPGFLLPTYKIWGNERFKITSLRVWTFGRRLAIEPNSFFPPSRFFISAQQWLRLEEPTAVFNAMRPPVEISISRYWR